MSEIERAKRRDPEAFIRLIEEHRGALLRVAHGFFHREEDVADAVQDTILNAWEHLPQLQKNRYFKSWLVRILINNCIRIYRANRSCVSLEEQSEMGSGCEVFGSVEFQGMLASIPEDSRLIFQLFYGEHFTVSEISAILHLNENTVKSKLRRGRERLRESLGDH